MRWSKTLFPLVFLLATHLLLAEVSIGTMTELINEGVGMRKSHYVKIVEETLGDSDLSFDGKTRQWKFQFQGETYYMRYESKKNVIVGIGLRSGVFPDIDYGQMEPSWNVLNEIYDGVLMNPAGSDIDKGKDLPPLEAVKTDEGYGTCTVWRNAEQPDRVLRLSVWYRNGQDLSTPLISVTDGKHRDAFYTRLD